MRKLTPLIKRLYAEARVAGLSFPLGRAVAAANRHYNDGSYSRQWKNKLNVDGDDLALMKSFGEARAKRWLMHWQGGGSVKCLGRMQTEEQERKQLARQK